MRAASALQYSRFCAQMVWSDDPLSAYDPEDPDTSAFTTQFVSVFFVDVDKGLEVRIEFVAVRIGFGF